MDGDAPEHLPDNPPKAEMNLALRALLIIVLGLGLAGFGLCSLCGGFFAVASLAESRSSMQGMVGVGLGFLVVAGLLAWGCWKGLRALGVGPTRKAALGADATPPSPPPPPAPPLPPAA